MTKYIKTLFAITFVALCFACSDRTIGSFEVPDAQDQGINNNSNLDQFIDDVKPFEDTDTQLESFYNDNSAADVQK